MNNIDLKRFLDAHNQTYLRALSEIKNGRKESHWMWYIFPQLKGLGQSETAQFYGIIDIEEAIAYLDHPVLGDCLVEIASALLSHNNKSVTQILGTPDDLKLCSSMTLFAHVPNAHPIFEKVIEKYFNGVQDELTLRILRKNKLNHDAV